MPERTGAGPSSRPGHREAPPSTRTGTAARAPGRAQHPRPCFKAAWGQEGTVTWGRPEATALLCEFIIHTRRRPRSVALAPAPMGLSRGEREHGPPVLCGGTSPAQLSAPGGAVTPPTAQQLPGRAGLACRLSLLASPPRDPPWGKAATGWLECSRSPAGARSPPRTRGAPPRGGPRVPSLQQLEAANLPGGPSGRRGAGDSGGPGPRNHHRGETAAYQNTLF